jgi:mRNA-degrading endonuclease RelE of RelBE toxin-antitoxin system
MWIVTVKKSVAKQLAELPEAIQERFSWLAEELEADGPVRSSWSHYGKLRAQGNQDRYHCHIKSGRPTYVVCWEVLDQKTQTLEVYYVGTHEKAPY